MASIKLALAIAALAAAFYAGCQITGWRYQRDIADMQTAAAAKLTATDQQWRAAERNVQQLTDQLAQAQAKAEQTAQRTHSQIQKEVARYANAHHSTAADPTGCRVDPDWVRLHNAAARNLPAPVATTGQPAAEPATLADALQVVTHNYALATTCESRLAGWQAWYAQVKTALGEAHGTPQTAHP